MAQRHLFFHQRRDTELKLTQLLKTETKLIVGSAVVKGTVKQPWKLYRHTEKTERM